METINDFQIRTASNRDIPGITALIKEILHEFGLEFDSKTSDNDILDIEKSYTDNGGVFIILENSDHIIIATAALFRESDKACTLRKMYIDKNYRGLGLGKKLMELILQKAADMNYEEMILETNAGMTSAIRLYEKYGFIRIDNIIPESPRCNIVMKKIL